MGHQRVQWLAESRAEQEIDSSHIELVSSELIVDQTHAQEWKNSPESTVFKEATLIHGDKLAAKVFTALFVEGGVEDAVRLCNVERVRDDWVKRHIALLSFIN